MPIDYRYAGGFPQHYQQRVCDMLDYHDKADRKAALKKTLATPMTIAALGLVGVAGVASQILFPVYLVSVPLVIEVYEALKDNYEDNLDAIKVIRMREFDVQIAPEADAELLAYLATRATNDNEAFYYPPEYIELDPFPPMYDHNDLFRADPLPGNVKETSF